MYKYYKYMYIYILFVVVDQESDVAIDELLRGYCFNATIPTILTSIRRVGRKDIGVNKGAADLSPPLRIRAALAARIREHWSFD